MNPLPLVLQAYTPQIDLGDWQIVIAVNRKRNVISVERWHSSERPYRKNEAGDQSIRIETGIRAFRRQMPVLAGALEKAKIEDLSEQQIVDVVFAVLANVYRPVPHAAGGHDDNIAPADFADFVAERKREALAALNAVAH